MGAGIHADETWLASRYKGCVLGERPMSQIMSLLAVVAVWVDRPLQERGRGTCNMT